MKKRFLISIFTMLMAVSFMVGLAACGDSSDGNKSVTSDGLELELEGNVYKVTGLGSYKGSDVVIPSEYDGKAVAYVDDFAFYNCDTVTSVCIPDTVISIGDYAFYSCDALESVTIPKSVTRIGEYAFYGCVALEEMFYGPVVLTEVYDTSFFYAGRDGDGIAFTMGKEVTEIPAYLFYPYDGNALYAPKISSVDYEEGCECAVIGAYAFYDCADLMSLSLPGSVKTIGSCAFYDCEKLASVTVPECLTSVSTNSFYNCTSLERIYFDAASFSYSLTNYFYNSAQEGVTATIGKNVTKIPSGLFIGFYSLTDVEFEDPDTCEEIGYDAFYRCTSLENVAIPDSVTVIGDYAFYNCTSLGNAAIPDGVETVGSYAFYNCYSLNNAALGANVSYIGSYAFYNCYNLTSVTIGAEVSTIGSSAFYNCYKLIEVENRSSLEIVPGSTGYGYVAYYAENVYMTGVGKSFLYVTGEGFEIYDDGDTAYVMGYLGTDTEIKLPDIGRGYGIHDYAFYNLTSVEKVATGNDATSVGAYAFYGCTSLESVSTGSGILSVGTYAFGNCTSLISLTMTSGVTSIKSYAFYGCTALESIAIPDSVTQIGNDIFSGCSSLRSVSTGNGITEINSSMFAGCYSLESVTVGSEVRSIGAYAFQNCTSLKSVTVPSSVTSIGIYAFCACSSLASVVIPSSVVSIKDYAFGDCTSLRSVIFEEESKCTSIGIRSFACCPITEIIIPDSVITIDERAFVVCSSLTTVTLGRCVSEIGSMAFVSCYCLVEVINFSSLHIVAGSSDYGAVAAHATNVYTESNFESKLFTVEDGYIFFNDNGTIYLIGYNGADTEMILPSNLGFNYNIYDRAFYDNSSITSVIIGDSVISIGDYAFCDCASLVVVEMGDNVTSIGKCAFSSTYIVSITIPYGVSEIGDGAFSSCYCLIEVYNLSPLSIKAGSSENGYVGYYAKNVYTDTSGESKITTTNDGYIFYNDGDKHYLMGYFGGKSNITLPSNVDYNYEIYKYAFYHCSYIKNLVIPQNVTAIGSYAFYRCDSLVSVVIPNSVTSIDSKVLNNCLFLTTVYFGGNEEEWSEFSFETGNLKSSTIYFYNESEPTSDGNFWHYVDGEITIWKKEN